MPRRHPMKLHRADHTMVRSGHLNTLVTAEVEHAVALSRQFADRPFSEVVVYRIVAILGKGKYTIPKLVEVVQRRREVWTALRLILRQRRIKI